MRNWVSILLVLALAGVILAPSSAAAITVPLARETDLTNALRTGGVILLTFSGQITLTQPLVIRGDVTLAAPATNQAVLSGNNALRLFVVQPGAVLTLSNLSLINGRQTATNTLNGGVTQTAGAAIYNDHGSVFLHSCVLSNHTVIAGAGARGQNDFRPTPGANGGSALGGAIHNNQGSVSIDSSTLLANGIFAGAGGAGADGIDTGLGQNGSSGGDSGLAAGGAVFSSGGSLRVSRSTLSGNAVSGAPGGAQGNGGGLLGFPGQPGLSSPALGGAISGDAGARLAVWNSTFFGNTITNAPGLTGLAGRAGKAGGSGTPGGASFGGAISSSGRLALTNCTFSANTAGGGTGGNGGVAGASNFEISGGAGGSGGAAQGGAVWNDGAGEAFVQSCTFTGNTALGGAGGAGGAGTRSNGPTGATGPGAGGAVASAGASFALVNSVLDNSVPSLNVSGSLQDLGANLCSDSSLAATHPTSRTNVSPKVFGLADNSGPTLTCALDPTSPARDAGLAAYCTPADQRGAARMGSCDIGAFEFETARLAAALNGPLLALTTTSRFVGKQVQYSDFSTTSFQWTTLPTSAILSNNQAVVWVPLTNLTSPRFFRLKY